MPAHAAAFSFDIEDWFHSEFVPEPDRHASRESVVERGTTRILDLLRACEARATFFLLGDVVRTHPALLRRIVDEGHEVASHGVDHRPLWRLDADTLARQLEEFRRLVERVLGRFPVVGYRAPSFSLDRSTAWALDVLRDQGYAYDSSIFPARVRLYGVPDAPVGIYRPARTTSHGTIRTARWSSSRSRSALPVRSAFPSPAASTCARCRSRSSAWCSDSIQRRRPVALYLHPRECAPESVRLPLGTSAALITYTGLAGVAGKLERLLRRHGSRPMREVLAAGGYLPG